MEHDPVPQNRANREVNRFQPPGTFTVPLPSWSTQRPCTDAACDNVSVAHGGTFVVTLNAACTLGLLKVELAHLIASGYLTRKPDQDRHML